MELNARTDRSAVVDTSRSPHARLRPTSIGAFRLDDAFWSPRLRTTREVTLRQQFEQCELTGRIDNFRRAAGKIQGDFQGRFYNDSDVYKWLEACCFALASEPDAELERLVDGVIDEIADAQSPNGYLNTYFSFELAPERWTDLTTKHEMYCAGHFIQAAVAHHRATAKRAALDVAIRLADHICDTFGSTARPGTDGHEEIELALVELYRETGDRRYLDEASFLLDQRGQQPPVIGGSSYHQDHLPVRAQHDIVGHAVRATYLACGMADVAIETGDAGLRAALEHLWQSAFARKAFLTGGLGAHWRDEAFGADFELPSERAYAETCAAIGGFMWNWRMLLASGEARFADWMETALYNGILSGISLDGTEYFYQNPLADQGTHRRQPWFGTACCPPNIARLLLSLPGYLSTTSPEGLWLHLYAAGALRTPLPSGGTASLGVETNYPWEGAVRLTVQELGSGATCLFLRLPAWCERPRLSVNGEPLLDLRPGTYVALHRAWSAGDVVQLDLPMEVRRVVAHPHVMDTTGRVALMRGPLVYCVEGADLPGVDVRALQLTAAAVLRAERGADLPGGVTVLRGEAMDVSPAGWDRRLYLPEPRATEPERRPVPIVAIPYYAWANRTPGPMQVWLRDGRYNAPS